MLSPHAFPIFIIISIYTRKYNFQQKIHTSSPQIMHFFTFISLHISFAAECFYQHPRFFLRFHPVGLHRHDNIIIRRILFHDTIKQRTSFRRQRLIRVTHITTASSCPTRITPISTFSCLIYLNRSTFFQKHIPRPATLLPFHQPALP